MPSVLPASLPKYAELHCVSNFTFLRGASRGEELVERAAQLGYTALAITDECSLAGVVRAHVAAKEHNLQLIIGIQVQLLTENLIKHDASAQRTLGSSGLRNNERTPIFVDGSQRTTLDPS